MDLEIIQADAFTDKPFTGNPAAVCITQSALDETLMQQIANEMNLAETAFLHPEKDGYRLQWFTPTTEVDLCGHATLASTHVLYEKNLLPSHEKVNYYTRSGLLQAEVVKEGILMTFPAIPQTEVAIDPDYEDTFGVKIKNLGNNEQGYMVAEVNSEEIVKNFTPDYNALLDLGKKVIILTAKSSKRSYDFISRVFAPAFGINEDPVTGAAHCCLAPYWAPKLGKDKLTGFQASPRGGLVGMELQGKEKVILKGKAVTVLKGNLHFD